VLACVETALVSGWSGAIENFPVAAAAEWAEGTVPVPDGKGVFNLCSWFGVAVEEVRGEGFGLRRESVDGENPAKSLGQQCGPVTDQRAADWTRDLLRDVAGQAVDALQDELVAWSVQEHWMSPGFVEEHSQAHGALLQEG
jgi:hypothetical protein